MEKYSRRHTLKLLASAGCAVALGGGLFNNLLTTREQPSTEEVLYLYSQLDNSQVEKRPPIRKVEEQIVEEEVSRDEFVKQDEVIPKRIETGREFIDSLGWKGKIVYLVYGRPSKRKETTWGTLGASQTAEDSWELVDEQKREIQTAIDKTEEEFALSVLNPVYFSTNGRIKDIYVQKALELATENNGVVALDFQNFQDARQVIQRLETIIPSDYLPRLGVSLDLEWFPHGNADASSINDFAEWFSEKHSQWSDEKGPPGLVFLYTMHGSERVNHLGKILSPQDLSQYYLDKRTLVVPIFDGYGGIDAKRRVLSDLVGGLPDHTDFPALTGIMEFRSRWEDRFDQATVSETFSLLDGQPVYFLASQ